MPVRLHIARSLVGLVVVGLLTACAGREGVWTARVLEASDVSVLSDGTTVVWTQDDADSWIGRELATGEPILEVSTAEPSRLTIARSPPAVLIVDEGAYLLALGIQRLEGGASRAVLVARAIDDSASLVLLSPGDIVSIDDDNPLDIGEWPGSVRVGESSGRTLVVWFRAFFYLIDADPSGAWYRGWEVDSSAPDWGAPELQVGPEWTFPDVVDWEHPPYALIDRDKILLTRSRTLTLDMVDGTVTAGASPGTSFNEVFWSLGPNSACDSETLGGFVLYSGQEHRAHLLDDAGVGVGSVSVLDGDRGQTEGPGFGVCAPDLNGDGNPELILSDTAQRTISFYDLPDVFPATTDPWRTLRGPGGVEEWGTTLRLVESGEGRFLLVGSTEDTGERSVRAYTSASWE